MQLKELIPPFIIRVARELRSHGSGSYLSYREAALACSAYGYEQDALLDVVLEKTRRYRDFVSAQRPLTIDHANARTPLGLSLAITNNTLRVIDVGGACGAHYFFAKALLSKRVKLQWHVVETEGMVSRGLRLANPELRFFGNLRSAREAMEHIDLVFSSGALQYVPDPYDTLSELVACGARHIFLTRVGLTDGNQDLIFVQESRFSENGPGPMPDGMPDGVARYPVVVARRSRVEEMLRERYAIRMRFDEDRGAYCTRGQAVDMYGYFGERTASVTRSTARERNDELEPAQSLGEGDHLDVHQPLGDRRGADQVLLDV